MLDFNVLGNDVIVLGSIVKNEELRSFDRKSESVGNNLRRFFLFMFDDFFNTGWVFVTELVVLDDVLNQGVTGLDITGNKLIQAFVGLVFEEQFSSNLIVRSFGALFNIKMDIDVLVELPCNGEVIDSSGAWSYNKLEY